MSQRCGLAFRLRDANNYYAASADPLRHEVRIDRVVAGVRRQLGAWKTKMSSGKWHELAVEVRGARFDVSLDEYALGHAREAGFVGAGKFGV